jgi:BlaI family penicillinase repressor
MEHPMPRQASPHPTELELEILKVLWRDGPLSGRQVRDALAVARRDLALTSVITILNIMAGKGYVRRAKRQGVFAYRPKVARQSTLGKMLRDLVDRAFAGSAAAAMLNLLETSDVTDEELHQLRQLIARKAKEKGHEPDRPA